MLQDTRYRRARSCRAELAALVVLTVGGLARGQQTETQYLQGRARQDLLRYLDARSRSYDPDAKLVRTSRVGKSDYTRLQGKPAHPIRDSIGYATQLLEANDAKHRARACDVIRKVISLQDTHRRSLTYGLWPWYAEEPFDKMFIPDYNWAAFVGKELLYVVIHHDAQLPSDLRQSIRESIQRACTCIRRRPLHVGYTNIAAMSSYVTLVAGERLRDPKLLAYGRWLFDKWYDYTMLHGSFTEFNSPTYTNVALRVVARMMNDILDPDRRAKAERLNEMLWAHKARRFHAPTWQWAGPHSRAYHELSGSPFGRFIRPRQGGGAEFVPPDELGLDVGSWRNPQRPPRQRLACYLEPLTPPREEVEVFFKAGERLPNGMGNQSSRVAQLAIVGTTYLHPRFALGTVNFLDFWEQHRNLIAYWGTRDRPACMVLRCISGRHGFCSAFFTSVQRRGDLLAAVVFATDYGNRFMDMDPLVNQTLKTDSLRIEFELSGYLGEMRLPERFKLDRPFVIEDRKTRIRLQYLGGTFAGQTPTPEVRKVRGKVVLVLHLYKGPDKAFRLPDLQEAGALFAVRFDELGAPDPPDPKVSRGAGDVQLSWSADGSQLELRVPSKPLPVGELQTRSRATVNGDPVWSRATPLLHQTQ